MGTILIAIGLGLVVVCVFLYRKWAANFYDEFAYLALKKGLNGWSVPIIFRTALGPTLQLTGLAASVLIVVGVALRFGVHSALVIVTVVLVGVMLRPIISLAKRTRLPAPDLELSQSSTPDL